MNAAECQRCGSTQFTEENGHLYCMLCNTQTEGFAKEVAADEDEFTIPSREVHTQSKDQKKSKQERLEYSKWTTIQAYNTVYLTMIEDFYAILQEQKCNISQERFFRVAIQIWVKYLKQSEIIFREDEHVNKTIKLHPASHYRDKFLLGTVEMSKNAEFLPMYSHSSLHMIKEEQERNFISHGSNYVTRPVDRVEPNNIYYTENDEQKVQYLDPRQYSVDGPDEKLSSYPTYLQHILNFQKEGDEFENFVNAVFEGNTDVQSLVVKTEEPDQSITSIEESLKVKNEDEDVLIEIQNYEKLLLQRMPSTSKHLNKVVPLNRMKNYKIASSPMINDLVNKPKLLSFLFITVRLLNFNVYLSDLIRWCVQGNIRYIDALLCLPKDWEIMWIDVRSLRDYRVPAYHTIATLTRHMINHCDISLQMFPEPDIRPLVKRFISDLNLPKDLLDVVVIKYDRFIARKLNRKESDLMKLIPDFEVVAILAIIFTLRDLFDLLGTTKIFVQVQNCPDDELFNWKDWLEYSKTRLHAIKIFILNLNVKFDYSLHNIDELLATSNIFFEPKGKKANRIYKHRSPEHREALKESFEMLFRQNDSSTMSNVKSKLTEKIPATLYPLKTYTNLVRPLIKNSLVQTVLKQSFRHKRTLPYIYEDGSTVHYPVKFNEHMYFSQKNVYDFFDNHLSDDLAHLFDLATILSRADLKRYFSYFTEAEMKRPVTKKTAKIMSQSLSN